MNMPELDQALELIRKSVNKREEKIFLRGDEWDEEQREDFSNVTQQLSALADDFSELIGEVKDKN